MLETSVAWPRRISMCCALRLRMEASTTKNSIAANSCQAHSILAASTTNANGASTTNVVTNWMKAAGHRSVSSKKRRCNTGNKQTVPRQKRNARQVNGAACCRPILVAIKPLPQTLTKNHANGASLDGTGIPDRRGFKCGPGYAPESPVRRRSPSSHRVRRS